MHSNDRIADVAPVLVRNPWYKFCLIEKHKVIPHTLLAALESSLLAHELVHQAKNWITRGLNNYPLSRQLSALTQRSFICLKV